MTTKEYPLHLIVILNLLNVVCGVLPRVMSTSSTIDLVCLNTVMNAWSQRLDANAVLPAIGNEKRSGSVIA